MTYLALGYDGSHVPCVENFVFKLLCNISQPRMVTSLQARRRHQSFPYKQRHIKANVGETERKISLKKVAAAVESEHGWEMETSHHLNVVPTVQSERMATNVEYTQQTYNTQRPSLL